MTVAAYKHKLLVLFILVKADKIRLQFRKGDISMATKVAINGFGRIGRAVARILINTPELELVAINDLTDAKTNAHLFKYDSAMGRWDGTVTAEGDTLIINGKKIKCLNEKAPSKLPWKDMGVQVVVESTGVFTSRESEKGGYGDHIKAGAKKVVLTVPSKDEIDAMIVMGVNDDKLNNRTQLRFKRKLHDKLPGTSGKGYS